MLYLSIFAAVAFGAKATMKTYACDNCDCTVQSEAEVSGDGNCDAVPSGCVSEGGGVSIEYTCSDGIKCFDSDTIVDTPNGAMRMGDLKQGDKVKDSYGDFTEVVGFLDRGAKAEMNEIRTTIGAMRVSGSHLVETSMGLYQAKDLQVGMSLVGESEMAEILEIVSYMANGFVAPLTQSGSIQADGFKASCFANIPASIEWLAQLFFLPRRYLFTTANVNGIDAYAAFWKSFASSFPGLNKIVA